MRSWRSHGETYWRIEDFRLSVQSIDLAERLIRQTFEGDRIFSFDRSLQITTVHIPLTR